MSIIISEQVELPPLARGIRDEHFFYALGQGITPARAGNTWFARVWLLWRRNYPRLRGEYGVWSGIMAIISELPPLARGIPVGDTHVFGQYGITPARAGNTYSTA